MTKYPFDFPRAVLRFCALIFCCLLMVSCGGGGSNPLDIVDDFLQSPDTEPIRATIRTGVPLAHIAAVAMEAVNGNVSSEVTPPEPGTCSSYPCGRAFSMELDQDSLPFTFDTSGSVGVAGLWTSEGSAILTVFFYDVSAGVLTFPVSEISTFPVVSNPEGGYTLVFSEIDINIDTDKDPADLNEAERDAEYARLDDEPSETNAEVNIDMDAWVVNVSGAGTDASYSISGGGEYIGVVSSSTDSSVNVMQLGLANVTVSSDCSSCPTEGFAVVNEVDVSSGDDPLPVVASALMEFDPSCDGRVDVVAAFGNYVASIGDSVPIDLNE